MFIDHACSLNYFAYLKLTSMSSSYLWLVRSVAINPNSILPVNGYFPNLTGIPSSLPKHHSGGGGACLYGWQHPLQLQDQLQAKLDLRCVASGRSPGRPHRPRLTQQSPRGTCSIHSWNLRSVIFVKKNFTLLWSDISGFLWIHICI